MDYVAELRQLKAEHDFFIGFDSDGCVFDSMEIKHKECFCPVFINKFGLQTVSKYAREAWDFVNLYSTTRGCNRFLAVLRALDLLTARREVQARGADIPQLPQLRAWTERESKLGNPALKAEIAATQDPELTLVYDWSLAVNDAVREMVHGIPPFPGVREVLQRSRTQADLIVVSQTPLEALRREWEENEMTHYVNLIAGQEHGTKTEHLAIAARGKYAPERILMIGDAPGDYQAAAANQALFFPVVPGAEEASWQQLVDEGLDRFFAGTYAGDYQTSLLAAFDRALPETAPWQG